MPTQKQQREAARRHLERQLAARQARAAQRKRVTLIASIVGTLAVIALIITLVVVTGGDDKKTPAASSIGRGSTSPTNSATTPAATQCGQEQFPTKPVHPATGAAVTFEGVTVKGAADLTGQPVVTAKNAKPAAKLVVKDLVVGKGALATPSSCVTVQYDGVFYKDGKEFDSSWKRGSLAQFPLGPGHVIDGFTQGIGGTTGVAPMHVGGRRIIVVPYALGYGPADANGIPGKSDLVFIVDLTKVSAA